MEKRFEIQAIAAVVYWWMVVYVTEGIQTTVVDRVFICFLFIMSQLITYFFSKAIEHSD